MKRLISAILIAVLIVCGTACDSTPKKESTSGDFTPAPSPSTPIQSPGAPSDSSYGTPAETPTATPTETYPVTDPATPPETDPVTPPEKTVYDLLGELARQPYSEIKLNITTLTGDIELKAEYTMTSSRVTYSVEQLNLLPEDGDISNADPNFKTTLTGEAVIENGSVTTVDGAAVTLPSYNELKGRFSFSESNFKNVKVENGSFSADVISPKELLGTDKSLSNMKIAVEYTDSAIKTVTVTYETTLSQVVLRYEFNK